MIINSEDLTIIDEIVNSVAIIYGWKDFYFPEIKKVAIAYILIEQNKGRYEMQGRQFEIVSLGNSPGIKSGNSVHRDFFY